MPSADRVVIIGGGPAGLTAALELTRLGHSPVVLEKERLVGGLARTETYRGFHFDLGGHRFFTKHGRVNRFWHDVLANDLLRRPRLSRIYYEGKFFQYPLKPFNALRGLGVWRSLAVGISYIRWQLMPHPREDTFEQWVVNRFGRRLFRTFFKTYTEKVWGVPCSELRAEWAAQRIKDLSLRTAVLNMFLRPRRTITTLIEEFDYPRLGPGMMWSAVRDQVEAQGGTVRTDTAATGITRDGMRITGVVVERDGVSETIAGAAFISSMPITELVACLEPPAPEPVAHAARQLTYRDFLTVCLIVNRPQLFPDNWIYIHDPAVHVGRIQNFKNWSPDMVPDARQTSLGLEYFCTEGDALWTMADADLLALATREVEAIGVARATDVVDGCVVRVSKAYPVYDATYREHLDVLRGFVDSLENLQTIGRNGLHRYNNQDHAMLTGMLAVENLVGAAHHDLWAVNTDQEYHEEISATDGGRLAEELAAVLAKVDRTAMAVAVGSVCGVALFIMTLLLVLRDGSVVGPHLSLLSQYFPGYRVTRAGSVLGLAYGFASGAAIGWLLALGRNTMMFVYQAIVRRRAQADTLRRMLDYI